MSDFKVGDLVSLKSGSPIMTVKKVFSEGQGMTTVWYENGQFLEKEFLTVTIKKATEYVPDGYGGSVPA